MHILVEYKEGRQSFDSGSPEQRGRAVFTQMCQPCHGPDRKGVIAPKDSSVERFKSVVRNGQAQMPAFSEDALKPDHMDSLMAYLNNPAAGEARSNRPPAPPPPDGQTRYTGRLGAMLFAQNGLSAIGPPWGQITAYDLNQGTIKWQAPVGTVPGLVEKGITANTGNNFRLHKNGPVVTAGGLIFMGTYGDRHVRAYDKETGKLLWAKELDATPEGIPAVYEVAGRQYVAFFASAGTVAPGSIAGKPGKPEAQGFYIFSLPKTVSTRKVTRTGSSN